MYFGFRSPDDICFKEDVKKWKKKFDLHLTVDQNPKKQKLDCDVCFITDVLAKSKINPDNKIVFLCGPPIMMKFTIDILKQKEFGTFDRYIWQFTGGKPLVNKWKNMSDIPASTKESDAMSKDLKKRGFKFVGTTICYAFMQAAGMVNDHVVDCFRYEELSKMC